MIADNWFLSLIHNSKCIYNKVIIRNDNELEEFLWKISNYYKDDFYKIICPELLFIKILKLLHLYDNDDIKLMINDGIYKLTSSFISTIYMNLGIKHLNLFELNMDYKNIYLCELNKYYKYVYNKNKKVQLSFINDFTYISTNDLMNHINSILNIYEPPSIIFIYHHCDSPETRIGYEVLKRGGFRKALDIKSYSNHVYINDKEFIWNNYKYNLFNKIIDYNLSIYLLSTI